MDENLNSVNAEQEQVVDAQEVVETSEPIEPQAEPVQAQGTEFAEPSQEKKAEQSQEENAKYAAARRKAEAEVAQRIAEAEAKAEARARDKAAAELAERMGWNTADRKIQTFEDFENLKMEAELLDKGIDPKVVKDLIENNPSVKRANQVLDEQAKKEQRQKEFEGFFAAFRNANDGKSFDLEADKEVFAEVKAIADGEGKTLADAYEKVHSRKLAAEVEALRKQLKAAETNKKNAESSPGSVSGNNSAPDGEITPEMVEANRGNARWFRENYDRIVKSRKSWGG